MGTFFYYIDFTLFFLMAIWICYVLLFAIAYRLPSRKISRYRDINQRYLVIFPAYKEDAVIVSSVCNFLRQSYSSSLYHVMVIADCLEQSTLKALEGENVQVVIPTYHKRSKARALALAVEASQEGGYDAVVILDADNHVDSDFLSQINDAFCVGHEAIQVHRVAKNQDSDIAYLDGLSEELNNSIFREGHNNLGLPSGLAGSGMAFQMDWFKKAILSIDSVGEDKELELLLLQDEIYTYYLKDVYVYDEKINKNKDFSNQRRRWIAAQLDVFVKTSKEIGSIVRSRNWPMLDKIIQWSMPPRILMLGWGPFWIAILFFLCGSLILKWVVLYFVFFLALLLALPNRYYSKRTCLVVVKLPGLLFAMLRSLVGLKSGRTTFIHTPHGNN